MDFLFSPEGVRMLAQGGLSVTLFIIWLVSHKSHEKNISSIVATLDRDRQDDLKVKEGLLGVLTRIEIKLDMIMKEGSYVGMDRRRCQECPHHDSRS